MDSDVCIYLVFYCTISFFELVGEVKEKKNNLVRPKSYRAESQCRIDGCFRSGLVIFYLPNSPQHSKPPGHTAKKINK